jgi:hypothetical protein
MPSYQVKLLSYFSQIPAGNGQIIVLGLLKIAFYTFFTDNITHQSFQVNDDHRGEGDVITLGFAVGIAADDKQVSPFLKKLHIGRLQLFFQTNWQALHRGCPNLFGIRIHHPDIGIIIRGRKRTERLARVQAVQAPSYEYPFAAPLGIGIGVDPLHARNLVGLQAELIREVSLTEYHNGEEGQN